MVASFRMKNYVRLCMFSCGVDVVFRDVRLFGCSALLLDLA